MSTHVELAAIDLWSFAAHLAAAPAGNAWALVAVSGGVREAAAEVADQIESLLEEPVQLVSATSPEQVLAAVKQHEGSVLVLEIAEALSTESWRWLDGERSRLRRDRPAVIVIDEGAARSLVEHAPNLWSWLAPSAWHGVREKGLSDERREQRLRAMREHFGFDDDELLRRAEAGTLPAEPDIAEWLVLIGKGHLIGR